MNLINTVSLSKKYGNDTTAVNALNNINIKINEGEFIGIIGASGSGKSTFLHLLSGLDTPTYGLVMYKNEDIYKLSSSKLTQLRRRNFGFIFQFFNLIPILTVEENITLPVFMDGRKPDKQYVNELIEMLGLKQKRYVLPSKLSGGQQQRVAIARSLSAKPSVVFADEPTGNLDSNTSKEIIELFKLTANQYNQTMVIVTHDNYIVSNCKRVIEIRDGFIESDT